MAFRRRDSAYSSADAYRSLHNPASSPPSALASFPDHAQAAASSSSEDEGPVASPATVNETTALTSSHDAPITRGRDAEPHSTSSSSPDRDASPLSPPRPFFLASVRRGSNDDRQSWSSVNDTSSLDPASDSEGTPDSSSPNVAAMALMGASATKPPFVTARARSGTHPVSPRNTVAQRNHHRRRSIADDLPLPSPTPSNLTPSAANPFGTPTDTPTSSVYIPQPGNVGVSRPPPSSFPFQSHPGNPDPGLPIPGVSRRASLDSFRSRPSLNSPGSYSVNTTGYAIRVGDQLMNRSGSFTDLRRAGEEDLERPHAPFMANGEGSVPSRDSTATPPLPSVSSNNVYRNSAAGAMGGSSAALASDGYGFPRTSSAPHMAMRAPFLSPSSRPGSSLWSPPSYPSYPYPPSASPSLPYLPPTFQLNKAKTLMPSSRLPSKLSDEDKPWLTQKDGRERWSWWLTVLMFFLGVAGGAVICFFGWTGVKLLNDGDLCLVLDDGFDNLDLTNTWVRDVELGGFGNGEFQMTTDSSKNLYTQNGQLYIMPTLTSDEIGKGSVIDNYRYPLHGCTTANSSACTAVSSNARGTVVNPVQSARISTKGKYTIKFGKVEVRAKLPRGDWLWPAIWMLPEDDSVYGAWPIGGEIDIMEARGNGPSYPAQGTNFVRSSLNYGVLQTLQTHIFGWWSQKQSSYDKDFHVYAMEWTPDWMRFYVDSKLQAMIDLKVTGKGGKSFFDRGGYPKTANNGSAAQVVVEDVWQSKGGSDAAPFDQEFYLILDVAAGGTSGWFPDNVGSKPWFDGSATAMRDFAQNQDTWSATWPSDDSDRAFRIDYVKMWKLGHC